MNWITGAVLLAWLGLWFHDAREFEGSFGPTGDSIVIGLIAMTVDLFARRRPDSRQPWMVILIASLARSCVRVALSVFCRCQSCPSSPHRRSRTTPPMPSTPGLNCL